MADPTTPLSPMDYATLEILEAHRLMDKVQTPRYLGDEKLSLAQRVELLASAFVGSVLGNAAITKARL